MATRQSKKVQNAEVQNAAKPSAASGAPRRSTKVAGSAAGAVKVVPSSVAAGTNLAVIRGVINRIPELRVLASGDEILNLDLTIRGEDGPTESVPVVWVNPPAAAHKLHEGQDVVVLGRIRRRFFRAGGSTGSRTELCAHRIVPSGANAKIRDLLATPIAELFQATR